MDENKRFDQFPVALSAKDRSTMVTYDAVDDADGTPPAKVDYIPVEHRAAVGRATRAIHGRMRDTIESLAAIGGHLIHVKDLIGHGNYLTWIDKEFSFSDRTAQKFVNIYKRLSEKTAVFGQLPPTALYHLAMPSTPDSAIAAVESRLRQNHRLTVQDVVRITRAHKQKRKRGKIRKESAAARLADDLRKALDALSARTAGDCEFALGEPAAELFGEARAVFETLFEQAQTKLSSRGGGQSKNTRPNESEIEISQIVDGSAVSSDAFFPDCTVTVRDEDTGEEMSYTLVLDRPSEPEEGLINWNSPIAKALRESTVGGIAEADTPDGTVRLSIVGIRYPDGLLIGHDSDREPT